MSTDLRERLTALADRTEPGGPPPDLWRRGVRRRRRRLALVAAASVLAVLVGGGASALLADATTSASAPVPTTSEPSAGIPDHVRVPSPYLPDVGARPLGPLAVAAGASRRSGLWGHRNGIFGIGADDGSYRFLPLAHRFDPEDTLIGGGDQVALSPDGRYVAYWVGDDAGERVDGVAVYDTMRDRASSRTIASRLGLSPQGLVWADRHTLLLGYGVITELTDTTMSARGIGTRVWRMGHALARAPAALDVSSMTVTADRPTTYSGDVVTWARDLRPTGRYRLTGLARADNVSSAAVEPGRRSLAAAVYGRRGSRLVVASLPPGTTKRQPVPTHRLATPLRPNQVLGWRDAEHVLVRGALHGTSGVFSVDARTGEPRLLTAEAGSTYVPGVFYASSLWSSPTVSRPGPPGVLDPRVAALVGAGLVVVAFIGIGTWRRRRALG